jgi:hypothetical protein
MNAERMAEPVPRAGCMAPCGGRDAGRAFVLVVAGRRVHLPDRRPAPNEEERGMHPEIPTMAVETMELPPGQRRRVTMDALAELAQGGLSERLRLEAAARVLGTARHALEMAEGGLPMPEAMAGWDSSVVTAREHVETLSPRQIDRLVEEGPRWAAAVLRSQPALRWAA